MTTADSDSRRGTEEIADRPAATTLPGGGAAQPEPVVDEATPRGCPFLVAEGGGWRLQLPTRDHRCAAVSPPAPLSPEKQLRLCLTPAHSGCATYLASMMAREARLGTVPTDRATRWGLARTTTVIEDPGGWRLRILALLLDRRRWPAIPAVLLVVTLFTLALSGFRGDGSNPAVATAIPATPAPTPRVTALPSPNPTSTPAPEPTPTDAPSAAPSPTAAITPVPAETFRIYQVKAGDTLSLIAARYSTTSREIAQLNGISVTSILSVGQELKIPN